MLYTLDEIERQLKSGEDSGSEFKEIIFRGDRVYSPNKESFAGEMVAFANTEGGTILLGVRDNGIVCGIPNDRLPLVESWIVNIATNNCDPPIRPILRREQISTPDGKNVAILLVDIHRGIIVHATKGGRYYERVGSSKQIVTVGLLPRLFQDRGQSFVFDEQAVPTATLDDLDQVKLERFFGGVPKAISWLDLLLNREIVVKTRGDIIYPTFAGLLTFGKEPQKHFRFAYIEAAVYQNTRLSSDDLVHTEKIKGNASTQIENAINFVDRFMLKPSSLFQNSSIG